MKTNTEQQQQQKQRQQQQQQQQREPVYINVMAKAPQRVRDDPLAFARHLYMHYQGMGWRGYDTYIGNRILYPGLSESMRTNVFYSNAVQQQIKTMAHEQTKHLSGKAAEKACRLRTKELEVLAQKIIEGCVATNDAKPKLRFMLSAVDLLLARLYHHGVYIKESEWIELKRVAVIAEEKKQPLILLPSHRSHIDYLVINFIMVRLGLQMPHIIAGENMNIPVLGGLLKSAGAVYIRREWGGDAMYKTVLEEYISVLLSQGMNFQCFVEGTRSRLGKLLPPKLGILKIVFDAFLKGRFSDCYIVPMSAAYDRIIETSSYTGELLGMPKEPESLLGVLGSASLLQQRMGRVDIRIAQPYSLKKWLQDEIHSRGMADTVQDPNHKNLLLKSLGYRVLADINAVSPIMPTALVGTVILTLRGRGVGRTELIRRVEWLARMIRAKGGEVVAISELPTDELVDRVISIHKKLIGTQEDKDLLETTFYSMDCFELSYYRNQVIHLFVEEAILCASLYTVIKKGGGKSMQRMKYDDLLNEIVFLSSLLKIEMIYKPGGVENNTRRSLDYLVSNDVLYMTSDGWVGLADKERACGRENYDFLLFLIWPFIESYWLACVSLFTLAPPSKAPQDVPIYVDLKSFLARTQALGKTLYYQGDLSYLEAVNKETLSTAFTRFQRMNVMLLKQYKEPKPWSEVGLDVQYIPERYNSVLVPQGRLWDLVDHIGMFRREGKNRRDNAAVSSRVLRMAYELAEENGPLSANQKALQKKAIKSKL